MQSDLCVCESVFHERRQEMDLVCTHLCVYVDVLVHVCRLDGAFMRVCACVCTRVCVLSVATESNLNGDGSFPLFRNTEQKI